MAEKKYAVRRVVFGLIIMAVGLFFALFWADKTNGTKSSCTETVSGTVTSVSQIGSGEDKSYRIEIEYIINGEKHSYSRTSSKYLDEGESVTVHYDPDDHNTVYVDKLSTSPFMFRLVGGVFALVGLWNAVINFIAFKKGK